MAPQYIEEVSDDSIVDAIACFGLEGVFLYSGGIAICLAKWGFEFEGQPRDKFFSELCRFQRHVENDFKTWPTRNLGARLQYDCQTYILRLTPSEWARRLVGKSEAEIAELLKGIR